MENISNSRDPLMEGNQNKPKIGFTCMVMETRTLSGQCDSRKKVTTASGKNISEPDGMEDSASTNRKKRKKNIDTGPFEAQLSHRRRTKLTPRANLRREKQHQETSGRATSASIKPADYR
ncbi:hypothetical protein Nepgr_011596 [Nepenthes gracilis]|uniref:Uncharacterized protein n=1 Tax=Nepenthes gracilis TaxID=150966 RepID=A0AAD3SEC7_NEPGR|nr:hypothetical protein Nepgr_011596 [Nepenthes gracilis]